MRRVLLIDDSPLQLRVREAVLRDAGFEVCTATTAESAHALLQSEPAGASVGVIVTDHILPGASGAEFVRQLREMKPSVPVIVITGLPEAEDEYAGLGVVFRQKPCPPPELIALVRDALQDES
ncbi:MAG: response regulator [Terriglobales bacterium]